MAFREVTVDETENKTYFKFNAIGDRLAGVFVSATTVDGQFGPRREYVFKTKDAGTVTLTPSTDLARKLEKAGLAPGAKVIATYTADKDIGKASPMKMFKVLVDVGSDDIPF
jgi:hypothetical protein